MVFYGTQNVLRTARLLWSGSIYICSDWENAIIFFQMNILTLWQFDVNVSNAYNYVKPDLDVTIAHFATTDSYQNCSQFMYYFIRNLHVLLHC